ncbi:LacI family transcriptional regulator [Siculibacillus lacustris]|uniref:LacI family transcriptional regulator n=1 Tax=Siculibacillus lacustris TaxID=1549641 RepID=A0A4Q9VQY2_9HYPH|nr:LacI family DNA-binding transcriptional regulator [Siculibacillus lacustris]TBW38250.1 LacI family transcriptional regulator [Siculibacillus lacustris]
MTLRPERPATIRQVAERVGTSIATVSYVLNGKDRAMRKELREAVWTAARDLGYVGNAAARALKGMQRGLIAVLVPQFGNNFFTRICVEVEAVMRDAGSVVITGNSDEDPAQERSILERLIAQQIDGCIIAPALSRPENLELLARHGVPTVILERSIGADIPSTDFVGHDNFGAGLLATRQLIAAGHRRIAYAGWNSPIANIHDRIEGYRAALAEVDVVPDPAWVLIDDLTLAGGRQVGERLAGLDVTALVIGHHHELAKGILGELGRQGRRWPEDLSIVLIGTPEWRDLVRPSLACIERPEGEMGRRAAELLLKKVETPAHVAPALLLANTFLPGGSIAPPRVP